MLKKMQLGVRCQDMQATRGHIPDADEIDRCNTGDLHDARGKIRPLILMDQAKIRYGKKKQRDLDEEIMPDGIRYIRASIRASIHTDKKIPGKPGIFLKLVQLAIY
jgi:hypothetical protein